MESVGTDTFSLTATIFSRCAVFTGKSGETSYAGNVERWKLNPAPNTLTYTTYQLDYTRDCHYSPMEDRTVLHRGQNRFGNTMIILMK